MGNIKKHQCPSCGGNLIVDSDKQMYHCTFCGSTYDYEYFREDQIQEMFGTFLSRGEFMAAADACKFMLKKDPHDFIALRGLLLAAAHLRNMDELARENKSYDFKYDSRLVSEAIEGASEEDREYFTDFEKIYSDKKKLSDYSKEVESLMEEKRKVNDNITQNNKKIEDLYIADQYGIRRSANYYFIVLWIINGCIVLGVTAIAIIFLINGDDIWSTIKLALFLDAVATVNIGGINFAKYFPRILKTKRLEAENSKLYLESGSLKKKISAIGDEMDKLEIKIRNSVHDFMNKDKLIMSDK